jgi:hypothetical protein
MTKKLWSLLCLFALLMPLTACNNAGDEGAEEMPTEEVPAEEAPAE